MTQLQRLLLPPVDTQGLRAWCAAVCLALGLVAGPAVAAPYQPSSDAQPLETLPQRPGEARWRELRALRQALAAHPQDAERAAALASRYIGEAMASGDPRLAGRAQAVLAPWWHDAAPPPAVRVARATVLQYGHQFDAAAADLQAALAQQPDLAEGWAWLVAVSLVRADVAQARQACQRLAPLAAPLVGSGCLAQIDALTGQPGAAAERLRLALQQDREADAAQRLWALTRLAEAEQRQGRAVEAEAAYRQALQRDPTDAYVLAALADLLLDQGRPAEVLVLLKDQTRADALLLRAAIAAQALGAPEAARWRAELAARFAAAAQRGDALHQKEEARFVLVLQGDAARALKLAAKNFELQREPSDARLLLEAALAARQPAAAMPALDWLQDTGHRDPMLQRLAAAAKAAR